MDERFSQLLGKLGVNTSDAQAVIFATLENFHDRIARLEYLAEKTAE